MNLKAIAAGSIRNPWLRNISADITQSPEAVRKILDCLGLPSRAPPIASVALEGDGDELQISLAGTTDQKGSLAAWRSYEQIPPLKTIPLYHSSLGALEQPREVSRRSLSEVPRQEIPVFQVDTSSRDFGKTLLGETACRTVSIVSIHERGTWIGGHSKRDSGCRRCHAIALDWSNSVRCWKNLEGWSAWDRRQIGVL